MNYIEEIIILYNTVNKLTNSQTFDNVLSFFQDITKDKAINQIIKKSFNTIDNNKKIKYVQVLNYIEAKIQNINSFATIFLVSCNSNLGFDVDNGSYLTEEQLYKSLIKSVYNYFEDRLNKKIQSSINNDEIVNEILIEYIDKDSSFVDNYPKDISVVSEKKETIIRKELQKSNDIYKIVTTKTTKITKKVNPRILARKAWPKFNIDDDDCNSEMQNIPLKIKKNLNNGSESENITITSTNTPTVSSQLQCRNCGAINDHLTVKCPNSQNRILDTNNSNYQEKRRYHSIKISNIPEYYEEDDLRDIFSAVGRIYRVTRPQNFSTGSNSDFCYMNLDSEESVVRAIKRFNNTKMDNCIIQVTDASR